MVCKWVKIKKNHKFFNNIRLQKKHFVCTKKITVRRCEVQFRSFKSYIIKSQIYWLRSIIHNESLKNTLFTFHDNIDFKINKFSTILFFYNHQINIYINHNN